MENIDDFMRQKFDSDDPGERFEFQEEYWEQAQALLEKEEERRRRRLWLWIALMLASALLAWLVIAQWRSGSLSHNKVGEDRPDSSMLKTEHPSGTGDKLKDGEAETIRSNSVGDSITSRNTQYDEPILSDANRRSSSQSRVMETSKDDGNGSTVVKKTQRGVKVNPDKVKALIAGKSQQDPAQLGTAQPPNDGKTEGKNEVKSAANTATTLAPINQSPINQSPINQSPVTNPPITNPPVTNPADLPIFMLPIPAIFLDVPERALRSPKPVGIARTLIAEKPQPVRDQRFSLGLSLSGAAYQSSDTAGRWAGWAVGAYGAYQLNDQWGVMLGGQWRFVPGHGAFTDSPDSQNPDFVEQLRYSFGYKQEVWRHETRGLHYLEIPLSAHWHKGPWGLEGGGAIGKLITVQNRTKHTVESSLEATMTEIKNRVKGNSEPYKPTYFSAFAGAEYRLNDWISVMARGQYRFTPVFKTVGEAKNTGLGNIDLGLRLRLF